MKITIRNCFFGTRTAFSGVFIATALWGCGGNGGGGGNGHGGPVTPEPANHAPLAEANADVNTGEAPLAVTFDATASYDPDDETITYSWAFGDGTTSDQALVSHTYLTSGTYTATLTVTDPEGLSGSDTVSVEVIDAPNQAPKAMISTDVTRGQAPLTVELSALQSSDEDGEIVAYRWQLGDGTESEGATVSHTYTKVGTHEVVLEVEDDKGATATQTLEITALEQNARFRVEGKVTSLPYTDVDGDINDPLASYFDNSGESSASVQRVGNPVLLNGFATQGPTGGEADTFGFSADIHDVYEVEMEAGQFASLRIINSGAADLDLYLLDENFHLIAQSITIGEFESVQAPADGRYLVMVNAILGTSKYLLSVGRSSLMSGAARFGQSAQFEPHQAIVKFKPVTPGQTVKAQSLTASRAQLELSHLDVKREALARFNELNPQTQTVLGLSVRRDSLEQQIAQKNPQAMAKIETLRAIKQLALQDDVEFAEPNYRMRSLLEPSDPSYLFQWHYSAINLPLAWDASVGTSDVIVAVIDSGIYAEHVELEGQLVPGYDFISSPDTARDGDGIDADPNDEGDSVYIGNSSWHGTHVAGTLVALMGNDIGGVGVAPGAKVMPLRVLGRAGEGLTYDILQAVRFAAGMTNDSGTVPAEPADVINLSLGASGYSQASQNLFNQVRERGLIVVAAAGNDNREEPLYPASYDGVISVGATDFTGQRAPYSNTGEFLDILAPGGNMGADKNEDGYPDGVLSLIVDETRTQRSSSYTFYQGTSMAAPHVAGVIALMKSIHPELTPGQFDSLLVSGALTGDEGEMGRDNDYGYGVIDAQLAVQAARELAEGGTTAALLAAPGALFFDDGVNHLNLKISSIGNGKISVTDVTAMASWLSVVPEPDQVNANGTGTYRVLVDRTGLENGGYRGEIEIASDDGNRTRVPVTMRVGEVVVTGDAGFLYIMLYRADNLQAVAVADTAGLDGVYEYVFEDVPIGEYYVAAGSDVNNDTFICDDGESCGFYPSFGEVSVLVVNDNKTGIDFNAGIFSTLAPTGTDQFRQGWTRLIQK